MNKWVGQRCYSYKSVQIYLQSVTRVKQNMHIYFELVHALQALLLNICTNYWYKYNQGTYRDMKAVLI